MFSMDVPSLCRIFPLRYVGEVLDVKTCGNSAWLMPKHVPRLFVQAAVHFYYGAERIFLGTVAQLEEKIR
jgi:hypothetical protein